MFNLSPLFLLFISSISISAILTFFLIGYLNKNALLDIPNERSSHTIPTPRGGGIAVIFTIIAGFFAVRYQCDAGSWKIALSDLEFNLIVASTFGLALLSWVDDKKNLSFAIRLVFHFVAVSTCLYFIPKELALTPSYIPLWLERIALAFIWVWFINLYNFMDGINGITGTETISIATSIILLSVLNLIPHDFGLYSLVICGATIGFLFFNWGNAKIFMGDVGSIPLGFILGWSLIRLAGETSWTVALIVPLYYLYDATFTLIKRIIQRKKFWQAHREHFYQQATQNGLPHAIVCKHIMKINVFLCVFATVSINAPEDKKWVFALFALLAIATSINKMVNWDKKDPSLSQIKDQIVGDIKQGAKDVKDSYDIIKEGKKEDNDDKK